MKKYYLYQIIAVIFLATLGIFVKLVGDSVSIMIMNFYRMFFAALFLLIVVPFLDKTIFKIERKDILPYAFIGLLFAIGCSLNNFAFLYSTISNVELIVALTPFFVMVFAFFILKERVTKTKILTTLIALLGLLIINPFNASSELLLGNIIALIVAVINALIFTLMRKENKNHTIADVFWFFLFATIFLLPFPITQGFMLNKISIYLVFLGVISTGLVYLFMNLAYEKIEAEIGSIIQIIITPLTAIILAVVILGEGISLKIIIGGILLITSGIYLQVHMKKEKLL
jgi:drug/metabolite transporter (DMT)-like permease